MNTPTLGEPQFASSLSHTLDDNIRIPERIEIGGEPGLQFELAGPRERLFFDRDSPGSVGRPRKTQVLDPPC